MNNQGKSVQISEGVRLYQQSRSPYWWLAVKAVDETNGKRVSTKIKIDDPDSVKKATKVANEIVAEIRFKEKHGVPVSDSPSFSKVADLAVLTIRALKPKKSIHEDYVLNIETKLKPHFGRIPINHVDRVKLAHFYGERAKQTGKDISKTQRAVLKKCFDYIFDEACLKGYIKEHQIPKHPKIQTQYAKPRDYFTSEQLTKLLGGFTDYIAVSRNYKVRQRREVLECYVKFMLATGIRPGKEIANLKLGDLMWRNVGGKRKWFANVRKGKLESRKGSRDIFLSDVATDSINKALSYKERYEGQAFHKVFNKYSHDLIFNVEYSGKVPEFSHTFSSYLNSIGISDENHTLYSLRHTYISQMLLNEDVQKRALAKQCGTSEQMIDDFYDHLKASDFTHELDRNGVSGLSASMDITDLLV
ncbi:MAG: site-specific integrase [Methylococcales bacterium]